MTCLDDKIKRKLKLRNFKKVFQITKIIEFEIQLKRRKLKLYNVWNFSLFKMKKRSGYLGRKSTKTNLAEFGQISVGAG